MNSLVETIEQFDTGHFTRRHNYLLRVSEQVNKIYGISLYKYGTYVKPVVVETHLTKEELAKIPEANRPDADVKVKRTKIERVDIGYYGDLSLEQRVEFLTC